MADVLTFPSRAVRRRPDPDRVAVQFDLGRWCVALLSGRHLTERRMYFVGHAECVRQGEADRCRSRPPLLRSDASGGHPPWLNRMP